MHAERLHQLRRGWLPGLPVGMTPADLLTAERCLPDDPPESPRIPPVPADWAGLDHSSDDQPCEDRSCVDQPCVDDTEPAQTSALERHLERRLALAGLTANRAAGRVAA